MEGNPQVPRSHGEWRFKQPLDDERGADHGFAKEEPAVA